MPCPRRRSRPSPRRRCGVDGERPRHCAPQSAQPTYPDPTSAAEMPVARPPRPCGDLDEAIDCRRLARRGRLGPPERAPTQDCHGLSRRVPTPRRSTRRRGRCRGRALRCARNPTSATPVRPSRRSFLPHGRQTLAGSSTALPRRLDSRFTTNRTRGCGLFATERATASARASMADTHERASPSRPVRRPSSMSSASMACHESPEGNSESTPRARRCRDMRSVAAPLVPTTRSGASSRIRSRSGSTSPTIGNRVASGGKSENRDRPTTRGPSPRANSASVVDGASDTIRCARSPSDEFLCTLHAASAMAAKISSARRRVLTQSVHTCAVSRRALGATRRADAPSHSGCVPPSRRPPR